jgi:hypothetical protein
MRGDAEDVLPKIVAPYNVESLPAVAEHILGMMFRTSPEGAAATLRSRAERPDYTDLLAQPRMTTASRMRKREALG